MDLELRTTLREYSINATDELAHKLARMLLRTNETGLMDRFYAAYWWLHSHPLFRYAGRMGQLNPNRSTFPECLDIHVARVDPTTRTVEDDKSRNTHFEVWLEVTVYDDPEGHEEVNDIIYSQRGVNRHYWEIDCGGTNFEEAVINLADEVYHRRDQHLHPEPFPSILTPTPDCAVAGCIQKATHALSEGAAEQFGLPTGTVICEDCYNPPVDTDEEDQ